MIKLLPQIEILSRQIPHLTSAVGRGALAFKSQSTVNSPSSEQ